MEPPDTRPPVEAVTTEQDLRRWYWLRTELVAMARARRIPSGGSKIELTERIADALAGRDPQPAPRSRPRPRPRPSGPLAGSTVLPAGQRCTQELRAYLRERIGPTFRFDGPLRELISAGDVTLDAVVAHWHATRSRGPSEIAPQFEYNRFTRQWRAANPHGDHAHLLAAWWAHRTAPRS